MSTTRKPSVLVMAAVYAALAVATAVVLYPVLLVLKKAFEPGRQFALSASPMPEDVTLDHFRGLLGQRGPEGRHRVQPELRRCDRGERRQSDRGPGRDEARHYPRHDGRAPRRPATTG